jgi:hypothetical protein
MPPRHPVHTLPAAPPWGGPPPPPHAPPYAGPPNFPGFNGYDPPSVEALALLVGQDRAEVLHRVLWASPTEQAGIADLIVSAFLQLLARIEQLEQAFGDGPPSSEPAPGDDS